MTSPQKTTDEPTAAEFLRDIVAGLSLESGKKRLPSRYLYDSRGCELFEAICESPEYYLTRTELEIMHRDARSMAEVCGPGCRLVEFGSGASIKTQLLIDRLREPATYIPVDISPDYLGPSVRRLHESYPELDIRPICADFSEPFLLPASANEKRTVIYFPGSTIGNFTRKAAAKLVGQMKQMAGPTGGLMIGIDLKKDTGLMVAAYNDADGVTASFTRNLLTRMQRELNAELIPQQFQHLARYNMKKGRIEIYLCSTADQSIKIDDHLFEIANGELINTEYSYKYSLGDVQELAAASGVALTHAWLDEMNWFGVFFFSCAS